MILYTCKYIIKQFLKGKIAASKLCLFILVRSSETVILRRSTHRIIFPMRNYDAKLVEYPKHCSNCRSGKHMIVTSDVAMNGF